MVYSVGSGVAFPREERERIIHEDPMMPGYYYVAPEYPEPPGYRFYQDDASLPWPELINPPNNSPYGMPPLPNNNTVNLPPPWYQEGYEPTWNGELNGAGAGFYYWGDQHNEYGDAYDRTWGLDAASPLTVQWQYDLLSPVSALGRGQSQWEWETLQIQPNTSNYLRQWWNTTVRSPYAPT